jgi:hypothetical protein
LTIVNYNPVRRWLNSTQVRRHLAKGSIEVVSGASGLISSILLLVVLAFKPGIPAGFFFASPNPQWHNRRSTAISGVG